LGTGVATVSGLTSPGFPPLPSGFVVEVDSESPLLDGLVAELLAAVEAPGLVGGLAPVAGFSFESEQPAASAATSDAPIQNRRPRMTTSSLEPWILQFASMCAGILADVRLPGNRCVPGAETLPVLRSRRPGRWNRFKPSHG